MTHSNAIVYGTIKKYFSRLCNYVSQVAGHLRFVSWDERGFKKFILNIGILKAVRDRKLVKWKMHEKNMRFEFAYRALIYLLQHIVLE